MQANLADANSSLKDYKDFLKQENTLLERYHRQGQTGLQVANMRSFMMDVVLKSLLQRAVSKGALEEADLRSFAILALGGYGRKEMCPFSDVDVMFFYPLKEKQENITRIQQAVTDHVLYPLWDMNFKVGHSSRDINQVIAEARQSVESKNAMLEARLVCGSETLWKQFESAYARFIKKENILSYIEDRIEDEKTRHGRFGNTVFLQEPDLKNGVGGLRDYHNAIWMARLKFGIDSVHDLANMGYLNTAELQDFVSAYNFLLRTRTELHIQSTRATDLLDLEKQVQVAWYLGYRYRDQTRRVEMFMRDYYRNAEQIQRISAYLQYKMLQNSRTKVSFREAIDSRRATRATDGFLVKGDSLRPVSERVFEEDPERLIRVFRLAQQTGAEIDLELRRLIRNNRHLIDRNVITSPSASRAFLAIVSEAGNVFPYLNLMNDCGILHRFIPEWKNLHCLVQHEFYHRFTADYHTLNTLRELDNIFRNSEERVNADYIKALRDCSSPTLPYIALIFHDIGKGVGIKGHAHQGALIAREALMRLDYNAELSEKIIAIIEHHLDMARFWQRYDVEDPQTAESFAKVITDVDTLRYLYVLTYCDARGTSGDLWNSYKNTLHRQLFRATQAVLAGKRVTYTPEEMIPKEVIRDKLPEISEEELEAHYNLLPDRYFIYNNADEIALHLKMVNELLQHISQAESINALVPIVHWQNDLNLSLTVVNIVTWDRAGLFYKLAGAFSVAGLSIVSSKAITRADHITVDTFYVVDSSGGIVHSAKAQAVVERYLKKALLRNEDLMPAILEQEARVKSSAWMRNTKERNRAQVAPNVGVYHELSLRHTIIEIQCEDRIGLLYRVAKSIFEHGFDISFARISTERGVAIDTFYIEQIDNRSTDSTDLLELRLHLTEIVNESSSGDAGLLKSAQ